MQTVHQVSRRRSPRRLCSMHGSHNGCVVLCVLRMAPQDVSGRPPQQGVDAWSQLTRQLDELARARKVRGGRGRRGG